MMMKPTLNILLACGLAIGIAGCGGGSTVKDAPVQDQSAPAAGGGSTGPGGGGSVSGQPLGSGGGAMMGTDRPGSMKVYFDFDSSTIDPESRSIIEQHAAYLSANPGMKVRLEGHADERGTREYNLALGERRGDAVERMLRILGIGSDRLTTVSYGEERPVAMGHEETSWRLNRRVEFSY